MLNLKKKTFAGHTASVYSKYLQPSISPLWKTHRKSLTPKWPYPPAMVAESDPKNSKKCAQLTPVANLKSLMHPFFISKSLRAAHVNTRVEVGSKNAKFQFFSFFKISSLVSRKPLLALPSAVVTENDPK